LPVLLVISLLAFGLEAATPGDPAYLLLRAAGIEPITPELVAAKRAELRLPGTERAWSRILVQRRADTGSCCRAHPAVTCS